MRYVFKTKADFHLILLKLCSGKLRTINQYKLLTNTNTQKRQKPVESAGQITAREKRGKDVVSNSSTGLGFGLGTGQKLLGGGGSEQRGGGPPVFEPLLRGGSFNFQLPMGYTDVNVSIILVLLVA